MWRLLRADDPKKGLSQRTGEGEELEQRLCRGGEPGVGFVKVIRGVTEVGAYGGPKRTSEPRGGACHSAQQLRALQL
ncbi:unnamed protein product [Gadus morhua 'NCC']